jgi:CheY-like chemotaxis protein
MVGKRVLVFDEDPRILDEISRMLQEEGCQTHTTDDARTLVEEVIRVGPDLILLEVRMSGVSGYEVIEKLQAHPATCKIPVVLMTARAITLRMPASFLLELGGMVNKPFTKHQLINCLRGAWKKKLEDEGVRK